MHLLSHLAERPDSSPLWVQGATVVTSGKFLHLRKNHPGLSSFRGARTALLFQSNLNLAMHLTALDGLAQQILLLPQELPAVERFRFLDITETQFVFSDAQGPDVRFHPPVITPEEIKLVKMEVSQTLPATEPNLTRWIIPTSGTTGTPKLVSHTLQTLARAMKTDKSLGQSFRWGLLYDLTRFAGIQVFLQALCGGSTLIIPRDSSNITHLLTELQEHDCNALSATPSMWRKLLMTTELTRLPLKLISMGGEIADQQVLTALRTRFPSAKITHIYASTEAGVGFSVTDGRAGFPASYLDSPPTGIQVRVDETGFLWLKPDRVQQAYVGSEGSLSNAAGWINTGDLVRQEDDRYLFLGRENGAINVGGNKVQPQEVEQVILQVSGVAQVLVFPRPSSFLGNLVHAKVVPEPSQDPTILESAIHLACDAQLADYKRPAVIHFVSEIELTPAGKAKR